MATLKETVEKPGTGVHQLAGAVFPEKCESKLSHSKRIALRKDRKK